MTTKVDMTCSLLDGAYHLMMQNVGTVSLAEALFVPPGGYRSVLGTLKHAAGWSHVYHAYAFDATPTHWDQVDWPRGLRENVVTTEDYLQEMINWFTLAHQEWIRDLRGVDDDALESMRPLHWGATASLFEIVVMIARHHVYHAGELNQVLSMVRGEAWEESEQVEENNVSTIGHRVTPLWLSE